MIYSRRGRRMMVESTIIGAVIGLLVVLPWTRGGYLLLLDWVSGPHQSLTPGVYGLSGSALDAMPFRLVTQALRALVGPAATGWLVIWVAFPLGAGGITAATRGSRWRVYPAVLLFLCNPFVVDRVRAGHVSVLLCLALLPWIFTATVHARKQGKWFAVRPALWYALAMAISPHAAWLGGMVILAIWLLPKPTWQDTVRSLITIVMAGLVYAYALVVWFAGSKTLDVTDADLNAYATAGGFGGPFFSAISLRGFWRAEAPGWDPWADQQWAFFVLGAVVALVAIGLLIRVREDPLRGLPLAVLTMVGLVLATGVNGPFGSAYRFLFDYLPLFEAMREQQKWLMLAVMGYAVGFGSAIEAIAKRGVGNLGLGDETPNADDSQVAAKDVPAVLATPRARWSLLAAFACACLPLIVAPTLIWGLGGTVRTSEYPESWYRAESIVADSGGSVLFLPWHAYQPFNFTDERTIATPAAAFFSTPALASDAVELPGLPTDSTSLRTAFVTRLVALGGGADFGRSTAALGITHVVLADTADSGDYAWVDSQPGLTRIDVGPGMSVYEVAARGTGRVVSAQSLSFDEWQAALALEGAAADGTQAVLDPSTTPGERGPTSAESGGVDKVAPTRWDVAAGAPGWVVIPEEWSASWQVAGRSGVPTTAGTIAFDLPADAQVIEFSTWQLLKPALAVSLLALGLLVAGGVVEHRRDTSLLIPTPVRTRWWKPPPAV